jgi:hypothetical protein
VFVPERFVASKRAVQVVFVERRRLWFVFVQALPLQVKPGNQVSAALGCLHHVITRLHHVVTCLRRVVACCATVLPVDVVLCYSDVQVPLVASLLMFLCLLWLDFVGCRINLTGITPTSTALTGRPLWWRRGWLPTARVSWRTCPRWPVPLPVGTAVVVANLGPRLAACGRSTCGQ